MTKNIQSCCCCKTGTMRLHLVVGISQPLPDIMTKVMAGMGLKLPDQATEPRLSGIRKKQCDNKECHHYLEFLPEMN